MPPAHDWTESARARVDGLIAISTEFYQRGWMWGTSGNLSVKLSDSPKRIAVTASGWSKGALTYDGIAIEPAADRDALRFLDGSPVPKPSAETCIHHAIYDAVPSAGAVLHVHTVAGTLLSMEGFSPAEGGTLEIDGLEMLKGWGLKPGQRAHVPIIPNWHELPRIAAAVQERTAAGANVPAVLVHGHGLTAWGKDLEQAKNHVEIGEFVFQVLWQQRLAGR